VSDQVQNKDGDAKKPMTLSLWTADGQQHDVVLSGPGGVVRFCVGDPAGSHSAVWRVWANRNTFDVYVTARDIADTQKISLHETGDWRHQFLNSELAQKYTDQPNRILDQWQEATEHGDSRMTLGYSVRMRTQDLGDFRETFPKELVWVPAAPVGKAIAVHIVFSRVHDQPVNMGGMVPIGGFTLVDGRAVLLLAEVFEVPAEVSADVDARIALVQKDPRVVGATHPRMAMHGSNEHGRFSWDIALKPMPCDSCRS